MTEYRADAAVSASARDRVRHRSPWRRTGVVVLASVLALVLTAGAAVGLLWWRGEASLDRIDVQGLADKVTGEGAADGEPPGAPAGEPGTSDTDGNDAADDAAEEAEQPEQSGDDEVAPLTEPFTVLVTGVDGDTGGLTDEERRRVAIGGEREGQRPDTIILLRVDPAQDQVALMSVPRDLLVERCDGTLGKVNGAYNIGNETGVGGPTCLVRTISRHTGIAIQHYVEVSFAGFIDVIEAIGGVEMYIPDRLLDRDAKLDLHPGCQVLDGPDALAYARVRNFDSDFGRMARQQVLAEEVLEEVTSAGTLANPLRLYRLVEAAASAVDVDDTLGLAEMREMAASLRNLDRDRLATVSIPGTIVTRDDLGGASVVEEDRSVTVPIYRAFRQGRLTEGLPSSEPPDPASTPGRASPGGSTGPDEPGPDEPGPEPTVPIVAARDVPPLRVLNAAGVGGLAARTSSVLQERGFRIAEVGDAPIAHSRSVVQFGPGLDVEAATVAQALGGIPTRQRVDLPGRSGPGGGLVVVLGDDMDPTDVPDRRGMAVPDDGATAPGATDRAPVPLPAERDFKGIPTGDEAC